MRSPANGVPYQAESLTQLLPGSVKFRTLLEKPTVPPLGLLPTHCDPVPAVAKPLMVFTALVWLTVPLTVMASPLTVSEAAATSPSTKDPVSARATTLPLGMFTVPKLLLAFDSVMSLLPAVSVVVPLTVKAPVWVMAPPVVTFSVVVVPVPSTKAPVSTRVVTLPLVMFTVLKLLPALSSVMLLPLPAATVVVPLTVRAPVWLRAPPAVTSSVVVVPVPKISAPLSTRLVTLALVMLTVPKLLLAFDSVMLLLTAASVVVPLTVRAPVWVMAPPAVTFSVVVVPVPKISALLSTRVVTLPLVMLTVAKLLPALFSVMLSLPAASVVITSAVMEELPPWLMPAPVSVMGPWADRLPFSTSAPVAFRFTKSCEVGWPAWKLKFEIDCVESQPLV